MTHTLKEAYDFGKSKTRYAKSFGIFPSFSGVNFERSFEQQYGHAPYDCAAAGYDAIMFLAELVKQTPRGKLPSTTLTYQGISGRHQLSAENRGLVQGNASILAIKNGDLSEAPIDRENTR